MLPPGLIHKVAETTAHRDRDELDVALARLLLDFCGARRVALYRLIREDDGPRVQQRVLLSGPGEENSAAADEQPLAGVRPLLAECLRRAAVLHAVAADGQGVHSVFPLDDGSAAVGALEIETAAPLAPRETDFVSGVLRIIRNHVALLDYGERDTLTGLRNRKTFETSFGKLAARGGCWLGVIDIDHFKAVNDGHGHLFGDEVLLLVSRLLRGSLRDGDHLFRFGGEEFVAVLAKVDAAAVPRTFERLRWAVASHAFPQIGSVTVSLGYTAIGPRDTPASAIERADAALYYAKRHGRDQSHCYETLLADGLLASKHLNGDIEFF